MNTAIIFPHISIGIPSGAVRPVPARMVLYFVLIGWAMAHGAMAAKVALRACPIAVILPTALKPATVMTMTREVMTAGTPLAVPE